MSMLCPVGTKSPYLVHCLQRGCGDSTFLTREEYGRQMMNANSGWTCPRCNSSASWDDENYDREMEILNEQAQQEQAPTR